MPAVTRTLLSALLAATFLLILSSPEARADHRYQGYYYPEVTVQENYEPRAQRLPQASRQLRIAFANADAAGIATLTIDTAGAS